MRMPTREKPKEDSYCVTADLLIPGRGEPIKDGCIVVEGSKITHAGSAESILKYDRLAGLPKTHVEVLMPGMWDCHVHLMGKQKLPSPKPPVTDPFVYSQFLGIHKISSAAIAASAQHQALSGARSARDVMLLLNAGFTSVREMAGYGIQLDQAIEEGSLVGPKIYSSNCIISPTGGHADAHDMPMDWFCDAVNHGLPCYVVR
ncbi:hypothetical protein H2203_004213 [Taxawa tesnikishii (nom. ined.)]|nr:hypothetical protein H2203_004213 [Dothideales sp. JES 119]